MGELTVRALNLLLVLAGCLVQSPASLVDESKAPAAVLFVLVALQAGLFAARLPSTPSACARLRRMFLYSDIILICWTLDRLGGLRSDLFCSLFLPAVLLGLEGGAWRAAGGGLLAAALQLAYLHGAGGVAPKDAALRAVLLILLPAGACAAAQELRRKEIGLSRRAATTLRAVQLAEFLSWVLYQLREYLISITSVAGTLVHVVSKDQPALLEKMERLQRLIGELNEKTGRLLGDKSALTTGVGANAPASFELRALVDETMEEARLAFAEAPISVTILDPDGLSPVSSDRRSFQLCLLAVLQNSFEACCAKGKGSITILLRCTQDKALIEVTDDGGGMQADEKVFEPLFNARAGTGALGFGLPMSRRILQRLGGDLRIKSRDGCTAAQLSVPLNQVLPLVRNEDSSWAGRRRKI